MARKNQVPMQGRILDSVVSSLPAEQKGTQDQRLYNEVLDAILDRRLSPGIKLKEDELADIFSVSRTVVRRALLRLSHDHIVDIQPNRGATIIRPDAHKAREILRARRLIEGAVVQEATVAATPESLDALRRCVEDERDQVRRQHKGTGLRLSGDFHIRLASLAQNDTLMGYLKELVPQTSLIIAIYQTPHHTQCSHQEHFDIIDVMATGVTRQARAVMDKHLQNIEDKLDLSGKRSPGDLYAAFAHVKAVEN
ncbi:MAG: GntR family transcriptional regulator [Granulosicoccus sp.]|nr:GntR family transcriptional regulator [Granulosicoccus sp.]